MRKRVVRGCKVIKLHDKCIINNSQFLWKIIVDAHNVTRMFLMFLFSCLSFSLFYGRNGSEFYFWCHKLKEKTTNLVKIWEFWKPKKKRPRYFHYSHISSIANQSCANVYHKNKEIFLNTPFASLDTHWSSYKFQFYVSFAIYGHIHILSLWEKKGEKKKKATKFIWILYEKFFHPHVLDFEKRHLLTTWNLEGKWDFLSLSLSSFFMNL